MKDPRAFKNLFLKFLSLPVCDLPPSACVYRGVDSFNRGQDSSLEVTPLAPFLSFLFQTDIHSSPDPLWPFPSFFLSLLGALVSCCLDPVLWTCHLSWIAFVQSPSRWPACLLTSLKAFVPHSLVPFSSASHTWDCLGSGDKRQGLRGKEAPLSLLHPG